MTAPFLIESLWQIYSIGSCFSFSDILHLPSYKIWKNIILFVNLIRSSTEDEQTFRFVLQ